MNDETNADELDKRKCDCCGYEIVARGQEYRNDHQKKGSRWLCQLCAGTYAGVMAEYPSVYSHGSIVIQQTICFVGNAILAAIREGKATS